MAPCLVHLKSFVVHAFMVLATVARCAAANPVHAPVTTPISPSVLLITIDTLRADHLGCYGDRRIQTPVLDALAAEGVRFENAYAQVPLTLPSHAVILTGTYPMFNGVRDFTTSGLPASIPTLAEMLRRHGYQTAAFVSSFALQSMWGLNRGFQVYDEALGVEPGRSSDIFLDVRRGDRTVDRLLEWLGSSVHTPFFVWLHLYDAHSPYWSPEPYASKYAGRPYDGAIAFDDAQVGRVLARLRALKMYDQTAIVVLSDHGESLGEHGEDEHGFFIYNATLRVPLIVKLPGTAYGTRDTGYGTRGSGFGKPATAHQSIAQGLGEEPETQAPVPRIPHPVPRVISSPVGTIDVAPTIAQWCEIPSGETRGFQGRSLLRLLVEKAASDDAPVYGESYYPRDSFGWHELRCLVTSRFKYIDAPRPELYDLAADREERTNLVATSASVAATLHERLRDLESLYSAPAATSPAKLDTETIERLRSLGYVSFQSPTSAEADSARADPKDKIGTLRRILHASDLRRAGRYQEANELLQQLQADEPRLYVVPFEQGENFLAWSKPQPALEAFGKALTLNPTFDQAALGLGRAHFLLDEDSQAATALQLALHLNPRNFLARVALAKVYWRQKLPAQAETELSMVLKDHPEMIEARADDAVILAELGKYRDALPQFQRALATHYRDPVFFDYLGITYEQLGEPEKAVQAYEQAVAMNPHFAAAYLNLALQYLKQNQPDKARTDYQKTCELSQELCQRYAAQFSK
jgi:arylsulfatase A-like enzyme/Flp pilus assembly protein TadD